MVIAANLGFPRIGIRRELKKALESYWRGEISEHDLQGVARDLRLRHWKLQQQAGIDHIPSNDFSFYDHVLDHCVMFGSVPERYRAIGAVADLETYFAMARGRQRDGFDLAALEMTKWFDTNYHYLVPEFSRQQVFSLDSTKIVGHYLEAKAAGIETRPVLLGPISFLLLGKIKPMLGPALNLLPNLLPLYQQVLIELKLAGASWVQIDEPLLASELSQETIQAYSDCYQTLSLAAIPKLLLATYFSGLGKNVPIATALKVDALQIDLVRAPQQLDLILRNFPAAMTLSLGLIDGRNVWISDLEQAFILGRQAQAALGSDRLMVSTSCSLLHCPIDLAEESKLDSSLRSWLSFARQKLEELSVLRDALNGKKNLSFFRQNREALESRRISPLVHRQEIKERQQAIGAAMLERKSPFSERVKLQRDHLKLPLLPTTTIGSFPQTSELRQMRAAYKRGDCSAGQYHSFLESMTKEVVEWQEQIGLDLLVHGEFERNDMVEYFGEQLYGFAFTRNGWVQSYGSRCVKPPIIFGDVKRERPMTVDWTRFAQQHSSKPVKGMLTGPVTMLQWSFVRDDQPRELTCQQIALAIRDEVADLEAAGVTVIQIDEPALREGLPLDRSEWGHYLRWAVDAFRLAAAVVADTTQIHTHMCYCEFNEIISSIAELDADVISIEASRSAMELLRAFVDFKYPNQIGPGVYDIHSPRVPSVSEIEQLILKALQVLSVEQLWVNPDCGLKTRGWAETKSALINMVQAASDLRDRLA